MTDSTLARRYAQALFTIGEEKGKTDVYLAQLNDIGNALQETPELVSVIKSKLVATENKKSLLGQLLAEGFDAEVKNFFNVIIDKGREEALEAIISEYQALSDEKNGIVCVTVQTAAPLSEEQMKALAVSVKARTGKDARFETEIDESIIGGVKLIIGDLIFDASVTGQLSALKQQLLG